MRPFARMSGPVAPLALLLAAVVGWLSTLTAQQSDRGPGRQIISDLTGPAIDRGLRANDPPRPARLAARRWVAAAGSSEYLSDSLIVRFRPGTSNALQRAMLAQVDGTAGPTLSYADFEIVTLAGGDPEAAAQRLRVQPDVEYAQPRYRVRAMSAPNDPLYTAPVELSAARHGPGVGHQQRRLVQRRRRHPRHRRGLPQRRPALHRHRLAACRRRHVPRARAGGHSVRAGPGPRRRALRVAPRFHLGRPAALRHVGPRHPRGGHRRPAHQQRGRRRGHGLQRAPDAGQGPRQRVGLHLQQPLRRHRRHRGPRHPLRGRQRRRRHQHEPGTHRPSGAGGGVGGCLCRLPRVLRRGGRRQRVRRRRRSG